MLKTFEEWIHREDYGDVEQLRRCWDAATKAAQYKVTQAILLSDEEFEQAYPSKKEIV